jgi:hypothetical protein
MSQIVKNDGYQEGLAPATNSRGGKVKRTKSAPVVSAVNASIENAVDAGKLELQRHFETLNQIGVQVAEAKIEMARSMPDLIAQREREILAANPIDVGAGARRVRESFMSDTVQAMLIDMGLEVSFE